jgi:SAM-dependent methyltransferase
MAEESGLYSKWKQTQLQWDDKDFLAIKANALMKKRWMRLNKVISKIIADEVVKKNEYITMLDLGAGRGEFYKEIQGIVKKYIGIEPSEKMLEFEVKEDEFEFLKGSGETITYENMFDACLLKEVLDHTYEPEKVIKNAYRALKEDGVLIVSLTNKEAYYKLMFRKRAKQLEVEHDDHLFNFNPSEIEELFTKAGFKILETRSMNFLRLPFIIEEMIGRLPKPLVFWILDATDAVAKLFLNRKGGSFIVVGKK